MVSELKNFYIALSHKKYPLYLYQRQSMQRNGISWLFSISLLNYILPKTSKNFFIGHEILVCPTLSISCRSSFSADWRKILGEKMPQDFIACQNLMFEINLELINIIPSFSLAATNRITPPRSTKDKVTKGLHHQAKKKENSPAFRRMLLRQSCSIELFLRGTPRQIIPLERHVQNHDTTKTHTKINDGKDAGCLN